LVLPTGYFEYGTFGMQRLIFRQSIVFWSGVAVLAS
jgi:hypothetical protein